MSNTVAFYQRDSILYLVAACCSVLISTWISVNASVINPDAICYLQSAMSMNSGLNVAANLCDQAHWPFYSALIYIVHNIIKLSYLTTAYFLNGIFSLISVPLLNSSTFVSK